MIITETRKSIIELIEPYMDKTLNEWCLAYKYENWNKTLIKHLVWEKYSDYDIDNWYVIDLIKRWFYWKTYYRRDKKGFFIEPTEYLPDWVFNSEKYNKIYKKFNEILWDIFILSNDSNIYDIFNKTYSYEEDFEKIYLDIEKKSNTEFIPIAYKILWHYDITAVWKYLSINSNIEIILQDKICLIERWLDLEIENTYLKLLYKPLHLFTEEEDKILLELLKELCKK